MYDYSLFLKNNEKQLKRVNKLIDPLKTHFGIDRFYYLTLKKDGLYTGIGNGQDFAITFFEDRWIKEARHITTPENLKEGAYLLEYEADYKEFLGANQSKLSIYHHFQYIHKDSHGVAHIFGLSVTKQNPCLPAIYMNNLPLFVSFFEYFERENRPYHNKSIDACLNMAEIKGKEAFYEKIYQGTSALNPERNSQFLEKIGFDITMINAVHSFSTREMQVIHLLLEYKTAPEVGNAMKLSKRTIEYYIENIKNKLNVYTKGELLHQCQFLKSRGLL